MKVHINVFTPTIGYSGWDIDLGFTVLPKNRIKQLLYETMNKWFVKGKNIYSYACGNKTREKSHIVHIHFY